MTYIYICDKCGFKSSGLDKLLVCPDCNDSEIKNMESDLEIEAPEEKGVA